MFARLKEIAFAFPIASSVLQTRHTCNIIWSHFYYFFYFQA